MTDNPKQQKFLPIARTAREDEKLADQFHGALETLNEKVPDDPVVAASLPKCVTFRRLLRQLLAALKPVETAAEKREPLAADFNAGKAQAFADEWQAARTAFHADYRKNKEYLEKLAFRLLRPR